MNSLIAKFCSEIRRVKEPLDGFYEYLSCKFLFTNKNISEQRKNGLPYIKSEQIYSQNVMQDWLLAFPANNRFSCAGLPETNTSSHRRSVSDDEKKF
jgi:hypothetical protein